MANELPTLVPGNRNMQPGSSLFPSNLNLGRTPLFSRYGTNVPVPQPGGDPYAAAIQTQGSDYDRIMSMYDDLVKSSSTTPLQRVNNTPITPQLSTYNNSAINSAMSTASGLARSGGLSQDDVSNMRARGASPIRSIYANAQRNIARQRALQGGYSPNYNATTAKMAREMSEQIGEANTNVEGSISEMIARNKLSAMPVLASLAATAASGENQMNMFNADAINRANEGNRAAAMNIVNMNNQAVQDQFGRKMTGIEGMRSLYGTTPAMTSMFGNQVLQQQQVNQQGQQIKNQQANNLTGIGMGILDQFGRVPRTRG